GREGERSSASAAPVRPSMDQAATLVAPRGRPRPRKGGLLQRPYTLIELVAPPRIAADATNRPRSTSSRHIGRARRPTVTPPESFDQRTGRNPRRSCPRLVSRATESRRPAEPPFGHGPVARSNSKTCSI